MKYKTLLFLVCIPFLFCAKVAGQEGVGMKDINPEFLHNTFLKDVSAHLLSPNSTNRDEPILSSFGDKTFSAYYSTSVPNYEDFDTDIMITSDRVNSWYASDEDENAPIAVGISKTWGDFMIVYILGTDMETTVGWLYTISFDGAVIDSLEFYRQLQVEVEMSGTAGSDLKTKGVYLSDLNSRLHSDLTISQTFIDWGTEQSNFYPFKTREGTRFDLKYEISSTGYFKCVSMKKYLSKRYTSEMLEESKTPNNEGKFGLERGNEVVDSEGLNYATRALWEKDINIHRFPIYEHKYKEVPQGVSVGL